MNVVISFLAGERRNLEMKSNASVKQTCKNKSTDNINDNKPSSSKQQTQKPAGKPTTSAAPPERRITRNFAQSKTSGKVYLAGKSKSTMIPTTSRQKSPGRSNEYHFVSCMDTPDNRYLPYILNLSPSNCNIIIVIIIIIALGNASYKMLHRLISACSIRKNQLWTSASSSVSQKSQDQLSDPSIQQATHANSWDQQQQSLSNPNLSCG